MPVNVCSDGLTVASGADADAAASGARHVYVCIQCLVTAKISGLRTDLLISQCPWMSMDPRARVRFASSVQRSTFDSGPKSAVNGHVAPRFTMYWIRVRLRGAGLLAWGGGRGLGEPDSEYRIEIEDARGTGTAAEEEEEGEGEGRRVGEKGSSWGGRTGAAD